MFEIIFEKIFLGILLAAPIGPVTIEMFQRGVRGGFWPAFSVRCGGAIGNTICLTAAFCGLVTIKDNALVMNILGAVGAWCLIWIGVTTVLKIFNPIDYTQKSLKSDQSGLWIGLIFAIFNPVGMAFWLGSFARSIQSMTGNYWIAFSQNLLIILGVLIWGAGLSLLLHYSRRLLSATVMKTITAAAGLLLIYYGCKNSSQPLYDFIIVATAVGILRGSKRVRQKAQPA